MQARNFKLTSILLTISCAVMLTGVCTHSQLVSAESTILEDHFVVRVYFEDMKTARKIAVWIEPLESDYEKGYLVLDVSPEEYRRLLEAGLSVEIDESRKIEFPDMFQPVPPEQKTIPGFPCYRTVEETFATAQSIAATYPKLATWVDVGNSWEKDAYLGGYDMMVLRLSNAEVAGPKPKIFITSAIHAREYTPAELMTRFAEYLVNNYGADADATWLLDYHEIHLMLQTNPDGRKWAEAGYYWRKNTNQNYCSPTGIYRGADLNRNFEFQWGCCGGSSGFECNSTYRGPFAASEPEVQAVQNYLFDQFDDQRGSGLNDPAPLDATGVYLDIHSSGNLILWPWGFTSNPAPNGDELQTMGRKLAYFNGYYPEQAIGLYPTDGTTDDFAYGEMGLAAYTYELGTQFFESCSYFENTIVPANMPSLIYAAKVARTPYMTPAGPDTINITLNDESLSRAFPAGTTVTLTATIDDTRYNTINGTEPSQTISAAEYYVDVPPWDNPGLSVSMSPVDGNFDQKTESVEATIDTSGWSLDQHIIFVRGKDSADSWGAFSAVFLNVTAEPCECDLNRDGACNGEDWLMFYPDWGREDCNDPRLETCECDLNGDGSCNGPDWLMFYPDWGREDCPIE
jgi:hypothetical protein